MDTERPAESKSSQRFSKTLAYIGGLMVIMLLVFQAALFIVVEFDLFPVSEAVARGITNGVIICAAVGIYLSHDSGRYVKERYRMMVVGLLVGLAVLALLAAGVYHFFGILLFVCSRECYIPAALVTLWGLVALFLQIQYPFDEEDEETAK